MVNTISNNYSKWLKEQALGIRNIIPSTKNKEPIKYDCEKVIGAGAAGVVFKAINRETGETVAIKCVKNVRPRFYYVDELNILKELHHPNCIELRDEYKEKTPNCS